MANLTLSKHYPKILASKTILKLNFVLQSIVNIDNIVKKTSIIIICVNFLLKRHFMCGGNA